MRQTDGEEAIKGYGNLVCRYTLTGAASCSKDRQQHRGCRAGAPGGARGWSTRRSLGLQPEFPSDPILLSSDSLILIPLGRNFQRSEKCMGGKYYTEKDRP